MRAWRIPLIGGLLFVGEIGSALWHRNPAMARVWGRWPLVLPATLGVLVGALVPWALPIDALATPVAALVLAAALLAGVALRLDPAVLSEPPDRLLPGLAAPLAAGVGALGLTRTVLSADPWTSAISLGMEQGAMGLAAVAFLGLSTRWYKGLVGAAWAVTSLQVMAWFWGIGLQIAEAFSHIGLRILLGLVGLDLPPMLADFVENAQYLGLSGLLYGAIVGATWLASEGAFDARLRGEEPTVIADAWHVLNHGGKQTPSRGRRGLLGA